MMLFNKLEQRILAKFKQPKDIYSAIYPLYFIGSLVGLTPLKSDGDRRTFKRCKFRTISTIIASLLIVTGSCLNSIYFKPPLNDSNEKLRYFQEIFTNILFCCSIFFGCLFANKIVRVFQIVEDADIAFKCLAVWMCYKRTYAKILIHFSLIALLFIGIIAIIFATPYIDNQAYNYLCVYKLLLTIVSELLPYIINLLMELLYYHHLDLLRYRFKLLNEYLEALSLEHPNSGWIRDDGDKKRTIHFTSASLSKKLKILSDPIDVVDRIVALHIKLTDAAHMLNYIFSVQQLVRITVAFVSIVTALFWIAVDFSTTPSMETSSTDESSFHFLFKCWALSNALEVILIVWITSETCEEANICPRILHKIRNNTSNIKLQDTIEIYSLQMYHNRLSFTVCGLFPLDYTLLYTLVAGITTYLVILIQFNSADFMKDTTTNNTTLT